MGGAHFVKFSYYVQYYCFCLHQKKVYVKFQNWTNTVENDPQHLVVNTIIYLLIILIYLCTCWIKSKNTFSNEIKK